MSEPRVDHTALRVNQAFIVGLLILAYVLNLPALVAFVAAVMILGTVAPRLALFKAVYLYGLKPGGLLRPDVRPDNPEPHQFAQGLGGAVLSMATLAFVLGGAAAGWALGWLVIALAALNLLAGICVGCMLYYWLNRLGVPGFRVAPPGQSGMSRG